jgi:ribosomal protein L13E
MVWTSIREWSQKRTLRTMLRDRRSARGFRSIGQLEKGIGADRSTTERLLIAVGARKSDVAEEWTLNPI